jgi:uncharacterized protein
MRRQDRRLTDAETVSILGKGEYGILSTASSDGEPYGVALNYCMVGQSIYFHCAVEGRKLTNIGQNPRVSFCVVGKTEVLPDKFGTKYESCIAQGPATEVFGEEKQTALERIIRKYSGDFFSEGLKYIEKQWDRTRVFKISIDSISGKARK